MPVEVEAKFRAADRAPLLALAGIATLDGAALGRPLTIVETDRYLDTEDGRLAAARWACRLRERGGVLRVSLKGPAEPGSGPWIHRRPEVEGPADAGGDPDRWPPSEALDLLQRLRGDAPLVERFRLVQERTEREVRVNERAFATLSLDDVTVHRAAGPAVGSLFMVELELSDEDDTRATAATLERLTAVLAARPGLAADPRTKLEHALELLTA